MYQSKLKSICQQKLHLFSQIAWHSALRILTAVVPTAKEPEIPYFRVRFRKRGMPRPPPGNDYLWHSSIYFLGFFPLAAHIPEYV